MINSLYIFVLKLNNKQIGDGPFFMAAIEFLATIIVVAIIRNT